MSASVHAPKSPFDLYRAAKRFGTWDPEQIDLAKDKRDFESLSSGKREQLTKVCALFYEGEVSVADTLAWFMLGFEDAERRAFLSTQIFEEVKHAEFFQRYFREVLGDVDTRQYLVPEYRGVLLDELRQRGEAIGAAVMNHDSGGLERAMVLGVAHYMGIVEGLLAVTGYDYFEEMLGRENICPGLHEGIRQIRIDEGRHLTHGMDYLREKITAKPEYGPMVQELFWSEGAKIPARTDFAFHPNDFGLDQQHMLEISYQNLAQRAREAGLKVQ